MAMDFGSPQERLILLLGISIGISLTIAFLGD